MRFLLLLLLLPLSALAGAPQFKISYYKPTLPTNKDFLKISTAEYQIEAMYNLSGGINAFANAGFLNHLKERDIRVYPATIGFKYVTPVARLISAYGYMGPRVYYFQKAGEKGFNRARFSGAVGGGLLSFMTKRLCLDSFAEWAKSSKVSGVTFGGWNIGTGFAYIF